MDRIRLLFVSGSILASFSCLSVVPSALAATPPADALLEDDSPARPGALPVVLNYKGREVDAPWRKEAEARIERLRKGEMAIVVNDASGKPVSGADVSLKMKQHAFSWGATTRAALLTDKPPANLGPGLPMPDKNSISKYQQILTSLFNRSGLITDLRDDWPSPNQKEIISAIDWLRAHNLNVRGYALVWPDWGHSKWASTFKDAASLNKEIERRMTAKLSAFKGKIDQWDVINEPKNNITSANSMFLTAGGVDAMVQWCQIARKTDPNARLFVTDDGILDSNATPTWQNRTSKPTYAWNADTVFELLKQMVAKQAPFDGIGFQGHFKHPAHFSAPEDVYARLERFAALGKDLAITELDVAVPDPKDAQQASLQADYTRDLLTVFFSHPRIREVTFWAIWEPEARKNSGALFRADASAKPNGEAVINLLSKLWSTEAKGKTADDGRFSTRGFYGKYEVSATANGKTKTVAFDFGPEAKPVAIRLD
jgi:endo-1,4-beta-xylanase